MLNVMIPVHMQARSFIRTCARYEGPIVFTMFVSCMIVITIPILLNAEINGVPRKPAVQNYSARGMVTAISTSAQTITITNENTPFDLSAVSKIESGDYGQLSLGDIQPNDEVILQGTEKGSVVTIKRIIDFTATTSLVEASTTASSSEVTATSTEPNATSTTSGIGALMTSSSDYVASTTESNASTAESVTPVADPIASSTPPDTTLPTDSASYDTQ